MQIALSINHVPLSSYSLAAPQDEDAESERIDLIVIGTKGTSNIKNMLLWQYSIWSSQIFNMFCNGSKIILKSGVTLFG